MIPKKIYYIFGLDKEFANKPFSYFHYLNILSAHKKNPDYVITVYYMYQPDNLYFEKLKEFCNIVKLKEIPKTISGKKFQYPEHICDFIRINTLYEKGGIYLDSDVVCIRSFNDLLNKHCVMGEEHATLPGDEHERYIGLCNAVILAESGSLFLKEWIDTYYRDYKSDWNYNSVITPCNISKYMKKHINIQPKQSFFKYSWDTFGFKDIFINNSNIKDCYSLHQWESKNYKFLKQYDVEYIMSHNDTLSMIYKNLL